MFNVLKQEEIDDLFKLYNEECSKNGRPTSSLFVQKPTTKIKKKKKQKHKLINALVEIGKKRDFLDDDMFFFHPERYR